MKIHNDACDGDRCRTQTGEVRVLPVGGNGNAILCISCFIHEMKFRRRFNLEAGADCALPLVKWESLKIYNI
jgi:hypothetical protein